MKIMLKIKFEIVLLVVFFIFSLWLMDKSFGYDDMNRLRIARHQIGDFGLHLSLIRSFSWGDNFPIESPFFPGKPLPYHYYFDLIAGLLEKAGLRIDFAFNGLSILSFTALIYLIYKLPQVIFIKNKLLGSLSVILFLFHSNLTFIDYFKQKGLSLSLFRDFWFLPDYINKGPFDGSVISIFFTLNVFLNQRHLIAAFAISLSIIYLLLPRLMKSQSISKNLLILLGILLGILSRFHTLTFVSTSITLLMLFILFKRLRLSFFLFLPAALVFSFHAKDILGQDLNHILFNPGFLSQKPLSLFSFISFWFLNLGIAFLIIPLGFFLSQKKQKLIFLSTASLFVIGNIFQLSYRIDHNHSLFNFFLIFANFYVAYVLVLILKKKTVFRGLFFAIALSLLTISGAIDLMAVKNDFQFYYPDAPSNSFMQWIKDNTKKEDVFLSKQEILDPVTLSGRKNFLGHNYYLQVMGYNYVERLNRTKQYYEASSPDIFRRMKEDSIKYIVIPIKQTADFSYNIDFDFFKKNSKEVYSDKNIAVFEIP